VLRDRITYNARDGGREKVRHMPILGTVLTVVGLGVEINDAEATNAPCIRVVEDINHRVGA
jgi:hypothetical protein